jgi:hypothetical protein
MMEKRFERDYLQKIGREKYNELRKQGLPHKTAFEMVRQSYKKMITPKRKFNVMRFIHPKKK